MIHNRQDIRIDTGTYLLRLAVSSRAISDFVLDGISAGCSFNSSKTIIAAPEGWNVNYRSRYSQLKYHNGYFPISLNAAGKGEKSRWFVLSNGRFTTSVDYRLLSKIIAGCDADLIAVNIEPTLARYHEKVRITSGGNVAGFRRHYCDSVLPAPIPTDWPCHIFVKINVLDKVLVDGALPLAFGEFVNQCTSSSLSWLSLKIGGTVLDLETEAGLLSLITGKLQSIYYHRNFADGYNCTISADARVFGRVVFGDNTRIGDNAVVVGPTILGDNVRIESAAVVRASVIGPGLSVPKGSVVQHSVLIGPGAQHKLLSGHSCIGNSINSRFTHFIRNGLANDNFRTWPRLSYVRCLKQIADVTVSLAVLILFLPVFPLIALAIKLSSPGPVFFKDKRQGLHGKEFFCLKFRTMIPGADKIQEKLRFRNQADGPQFKFEDDPRVTVVGKFLRDTFIDEIPQFINILQGQMSVVGPRPSPACENSLCPAWRDARLSVRPGITGLWQVCRTRRPGHDFQEWIYYDTKYIRKLSLNLDLSICWRTAGKLIANFIEQF